VCEPDGTGCTPGGSYPDPNAVVNDDYNGFVLVWTSTYVTPYSSGVPLSWTVGITYENTSSSTLDLNCGSGGSGTGPTIEEFMRGGDGDDGSVAFSSSTCTENPNWTATVPPGGTAVNYATFDNVPWPGSEVAIQWADKGMSPYIYPFT
jgi:hypothetical protein